MNFTYVFDRIRVDDDTGSIFVPIVTDVPIDQMWLRGAAGVLDTRRIFLVSSGIFSESACMVEVRRCGTGTVYFGLELRIDPQNRHLISQEYLDHQKAVLAEVTSPLTQDMETWVASQRERDDGAKRRRTEAVASVEKLRFLCG